ncbi:hypothetical protein FQA39_LY06301 [Lamprigera yunnana]|nr:hypothetical protein FQA39_LY06301 [Lamprigera yunnana]
MPAETSIHSETKRKKGEVERVSDRVAKTKNEIEQLKAQLQQLINEGINKTDFTESKNNRTTDRNENAREILNSDKKTKSVRVEIVNRHPSNVLKSPVKTKEEPVKKIRHYDQEMAREYIKKQKEKRRMEMNRNKETTQSPQLRKQRLQDLREKSLQLLTKNIQLSRNRSRSRSRETLNGEKVTKESNEQLKLTHPQLQNITIRSPHAEDLKNFLTKNKAAITIQSAFRGYKQRKRFKESLSKRRSDEKVISKKIEADQIFAPTIAPYPYNFINAVKRKLNLATRQTVKTQLVDTSVQISIDDERKSNPDLKSFLSHKCLAIKPLTLFDNSNSNHIVNIENGCASESDTSKNIPDLSSESGILELQPTSVHSNKRSHSSNENCDKWNINVKGIKKLKLRESKLLDSEISEHLNSDTNVSKCLIGSRDSIISFNKCHYTKSNSTIVPNCSKHSSSSSLSSTSKILTEEISGNDKSVTKKNELATYSLNKENGSQVGIKTNSIKESPKYSSNFTTITSDIPRLQVPSVSLKSNFPVSSSEETDRDSNKNTATNGTLKSEEKTTLESKPPSSSLKRNQLVTNVEETQREYNKNAITNVTLKHGEKTTIENKIKTNEIHLKFEAELHLLNDFNDSLRRVMAVEKSLLELHNKKNENPMNFYTRDTQTSLNSQSQVATINYSRGSDVGENLSIEKDFSVVTTDLEISSFHSPLEESHSNDSVMKGKIKTPNMLTGLPLEMFAQLIKDEDVRIENLKAILKIREKALVDRTKGELAWLEIQKKHLRDAGQLQQISAIKKKQRGLLIKLEHERHEMQRLKQMQKAASRERKSVLKEQRNMIKAQLAAGSTVTRIKRNTREERRQSGPFKVYNINSNNDSVMSETSVTRKSSVMEELVSVPSNQSHSVVSHISEELILSEKVHVKNNNTVTIKTENVKRSLLMREAALQKRKKVAEELLQWHQRLLEEERKIAELEEAATAIISQVSVAKEEIPCEAMNTKQKFKGSQLNQLWLSLTGRKEKKFKDDEIYNMSQTSLEKFCKDAKKYDKSALFHKHGTSLNKSKAPVRPDEITKHDSEEYVSDFESPISTVNSVIEQYESPEDSTLSNYNIETVTEISKFNTIENSHCLNKVNNYKNAEMTNENKISEKSETIMTKNGDVIQKDELITDKNSINESILSKSFISDKISEIVESAKFPEISSENSTMPSENSSQSHISKVINDITNDKTQEMNEVSETFEEILSAKNSIVSDNKNVSEQIIKSIHSSKENKLFEESEASNIVSELLSAITFTLEGAENNLKNKSITVQLNKDENSKPISVETLATSEKQDSLYGIKSLPVTINSFASVSEIDENEIDENIKTHESEITINSIGESQNFHNSKECPSIREYYSKSVCDTIDSISEIDPDIRSSEQAQTEIGDLSLDVSSQGRVSVEAEIQSEIPVEEVTETEIGDANKPICEVSLIAVSDVSIEQNVAEIEKNQVQLTTEQIKSIDESSIEMSISETKCETEKDQMKINEIESIVIEEIESLTNEDNQEISVEDFSSQKSHHCLLSSYGYVDGQKEPESAIDKEETEAITNNKSEIENSTKEKPTSVKKRVSEILADANISSPRDRSPRMQDFYVTAYDVVSPTNSPETISSTEDSQQSDTPKHVYGSDEVEQLLKKQLEIEQEIKAIQQQQQKEQLPYVYVREIPNKPPPPYTPSVSQLSIKGSILPSSENEINAITKAAAPILHKAAINNNIRDVALTNNAKRYLEFKNNVQGECYDFLFDLSKEFAIEHYKQFEPETGPSWMHLQKQTKLAIGKPLDSTNLDKLINQKVKQVLGYEIVKSKENLKHKWSGKKRDHVDELLVVECQAEEAEWTNYDRDELIIKDELTREIMNMLLSETGQVDPNKEILLDVSSTSSESDQDYLTPLTELRELELQEKLKKAKEKKRKQKEKKKRKRRRSTSTESGVSTSSERHSDHRSKKHKKSKKSKKCKKRKRGSSESSSD